MMSPLDKNRWLFDKAEFDQVTKKQEKARTKAIESIHRIGLVFHANDMSCKELFKILDDEVMVLGLGRLLIQAAWATVQKDGFCDQQFRDVAFHLLYQCYLKQKPKRKTKSKK